MRHYTTGTGQVLDILRHSGSEPLKGKGKKVHTLDIAPLRSEPPLQKRS